MRGNWNRVLVGGWMVAVLWLLLSVDQKLERANRIAQQTHSEVSDLNVTASGTTSAVMGVEGAIEGLRP